MNIQENRQAVVRALRSGEYTQTTDDYVSEDGTCHCTLGVVADLFGIDPGLMYIDLDVLLDEGLAWETVVICWNDNDKLTFDEIANLLEARWGLNQ